MSDATGTDTTTISLPADYRDAIKDGKPEHMSMGEYVYRQHEAGEVVLFDADAVAELLEDIDTDTSVTVTMDALAEEVDGLREELGMVQDQLGSVERTLEGLVGQ